MKLAKQQENAELFDGYERRQQQQWQRHEHQQQLQSAAAGGMSANSSRAATKKRLVATQANNCGIEEQKPEVTQTAGGIPATAEAESTIGSQHQHGRQQHSTYFWNKPSSNLPFRCEMYSE